MYELYIQPFLLHLLPVMATAGASSCSDEDSNSSTAKEPRLLLVVRHSERMDYEFGNQWISNVKEGPDGEFV